MNQRLSILLGLSLVIVPCIGFRVDCTEKGDCIGGIPITNADVERVEGCFELCEGTPDCTDFTYHEDTNLCVVYKGCTSFDPFFCTACISGRQSYCTNCYIPGQCLGESMGTTSSEDGQECREICQNRPGCEYFSHFSDNKACLLVSSCDIIDDTCDGYCIHGKPDCDK